MYCLWMLPYECPKGNTEVTIYHTVDILTFVWQFHSLLYCQNKRLFQKVFAEVIIHQHVVFFVLFFDSDLESACKQQTSHQMMWTLFSGKRNDLINSSAPWFSMPRGLLLLIYYISHFILLTDWSATLDKPKACTCTHTHTHTHKQTQTQTHTRACTHTHTRARTRTRTCSSKMRKLISQWLRFKH